MSLENAYILASVLRAKNHGAHVPQINLVGSKCENRLIEIRYDIHVGVADFSLRRVANAPEFQDFLEMFRGEKEISNGIWDVVLIALCTDCNIWALNKGIRHGCESKDGDEGFWGGDEKGAIGTHGCLDLRGVDIAVTTRCRIS